MSVILYLANSLFSLGIGFSKESSEKQNLNANVIDHDDVCICSCNQVALHDCSNITKVALINTDFANITDSHNQRHFLQTLTGNRNEDCTKIKCD